MDVRAALIAASLLVTGCQASSPLPTPAGEATVALYQYAGSRQCERGGKTPEALTRELSAAGVRVQGTACGHDGRMYAQSCGMPDGRILVAHVPQSQAAAAGRIGLKPLRELPEAAMAPCP